MNNKIDHLIDDSAMTEHLQRGSEFTRRYQAMDADDVPVELDQAIMLQAAQSVKAPNSRLRQWRRWSAPFAMAATLVLGISIVMRTFDYSPSPKLASKQDAVIEQESRSVEVGLVSSKSELPAPAMKLDLPANAPPASSAPKMRGQVESESPQLHREAATASATVPMPNRAMLDVKRESDLNAVAAKKEPEATPLAARVAAPLPAIQQDAAASTVVQDQTRQSTARNDHESLEEISVTGQRRVFKTKTANPHSPPSYEPSAPSDKEIQKQYRESDPKEWLDYIRQLRQDNKSFAANREWRRFIKAYPNYVVAVDDSARGGK